MLTLSERNNFKLPPRHFANIATCFVLIRKLA